MQALNTPAAPFLPRAGRVWAPPRRAPASRFSIVIPALNEEDAIGSTIERCLQAREHIRRAGHVSDVEIIVVSDGSTDRTVEIAQSYANRDGAVRVIVFPENRGYGAAIKEGFAQSRGDLVGFLDADGTCDPLVFGELCRALQAEDAVVALGSRMGPGSQMPRLRRFGNTLYALLLGSLSGQAVSDTASGMRVIRRDALPALYPLPDGLNFTPAMSARAIMGNLPIVEIPMPYAERVGQSKLRVLRDGVRFLVAISDAALLYHPLRIFGFLAVACVAAGVIWGAYPAEYYLERARLEEWMIYRLLLCGLLFTSALGLLCAGVLSEQILALVYGRRRPSFVAHLLDRLLSGRRSLAMAALAAGVAIVLVWPGLSQYVKTGEVTIHWSRPVATVFLLQVAFVAGVHTVMRKVIDLWKNQLSHAQQNAAMEAAATADASRE